MGKIIINFNKLTKMFNDTSGIKNISFQVQEGSFHALIGANGAGKTTMIRSLLRLYQNYGGKIEIDGEDTKNSHALSKISYISETPIFPSELNAREYLFWEGILAQKDKNTIKQRISELAEKFNFLNLLDKNPNKFSSGQKQKLLLMKILIEQKDIIILDEPTANLDPVARITFFDEIEKLNKVGRTIFISSHNLDEIENHVSWVTIIKEGKIIFNNKKDSKISLNNLFKKEVMTVGKQNNA